MKKTTTAILILLTVTTVYGQPALKNAGIPVAHDETWQPSDKPGPTYEINIKAVRDFYNSYGDNNNESWYATNYGFRAKFVKDSVTFMADYTRKGAWMRTIKTFHENRLAPDIRRKVRSKYFDYHISLVQEIDLPAEVIHLVTIEDTGSWMVLQLWEDDMVEGAIYKKAP
jgi:hypothetical protein